MNMWLTISFALMWSWVSWIVPNSVWSLYNFSGPPTISSFSSSNLMWSSITLRYKTSSSRKLLSSLEWRRPVSLSIIQPSLGKKSAAEKLANIAEASRITSSNLFPSNPLISWKLFPKAALQVMFAVKDKQGLLKMNMQRWCQLTKQTPLLLWTEMTESMLAELRGSYSGYPH